MFIWGFPERMRLLDIPVGAGDEDKELLVWLGIIPRRNSGGTVDCSRSQFHAGYGAAPLGNQCDVMLSD